MRERAGYIVGMGTAAESNRHDNQVAAAIARGIADLEAGRTRTTEEVLALLEQQRLARTRG